MVKPASFDSNGMKKGSWSVEEDERLRGFVLEYGHTNWRLLPALAGLARCGKSCRLRWVNYLKPGLKRGKFTKQEEELIIKLHDQLGNRWSAIAVKMPGRTDNEIKNYWHAHINKRGRRRAPLMLLPKEHVPPSSSSSESHEFNYATHHQEEETTDIDLIINPIADLYSFAPPHAHDQGILSAADHLDLPPFPLEDFQQMQIINSGEFMIPDDFWSESFGEDVFDIMELW